MRVVFTTNDGDVQSVEASSTMTVAGLKAAIQADSNYTAPFDLYLNGNALLDSHTLDQASITENDIVLLKEHRLTEAEIYRQRLLKEPAALSQLSLQNPTLAASINNADHFQNTYNQRQSTAPLSQTEQVRLRILQDPSFMAQVNQQTPQLVQAVRNPAQFASILKQLQDSAEAAVQNHDPFDVEAQRKIEEAIRQQNVEKSFNNAIENHPEFFGRVIMLYINVQVNGKDVKAFVDSGAQATIMSPDCAEHCHIMHLLDVRFQGVAVGVGSAKILGRVHSATMKIGSQIMPSSITVMEGKDVDLLLGLDMLKRYQACIDLTKNCLRIHGEEIPFLSEHELPSKARNEGGGPAASPVTSSNLPSLHAPGNIGQQKPKSESKSTYPDDKLKILIDLGFPRAQAIQAMDACDGNVDLAANMLFQS